MAYRSEDVSTVGPFSGVLGWPEIVEKKVAMRKAVLQTSRHHPEVAMNMIQGFYKEYRRKKEECRKKDDSLCRFLFSCQEIGSTRLERENIL